MSDRRVKEIHFLLSTDVVDTYLHLVHRFSFIASHIPAHIKDIAKHNVIEQKMERKWMKFLKMVKDPSEKLQFQIRVSFRERFVDRKCDDIFVEESKSLIPR